MSVPRAVSAQSLYVHIPFCARRCGYCDFSLMVGRDARVADFIAAIEREIDFYRWTDELQTVYLGGGTPSHLSVAALTALFRVLRDGPTWQSGCEVTVECNPNDLAAERIESLQRLGVNRLSVGVQSFQDRKLKRLERTHTAEAARSAVRSLVAAGWNVSIDLIFGVADESIDEWRADLQCASEIGVTHVSTYSLTVEKGTTFWNRQRRGERMLVDEDRSAELYEAGIEWLTADGYRHYEVSNFAQPGAACRHNLTYWQGGSWIGLGPGAASFADSTRWRNHRSPTVYLSRMAAGRSPVDLCDRLSAESAAREKLIFGLRQLAGVDIPAWERETGFLLAQLGGVAINRWVDADLLHWNQGRLSLTRRGLLVSDSLWPDLI